MTNDEYLPSEPFDCLYNLATQHLSGPSVGTKMERGKRIVYGASSVPLNHTSIHLVPTHQHLAQQPQSQHLLIQQASHSNARKDHLHTNQNHHHSAPPPTQVEYVDISRNQPATTTISPTTYRSDVRDLADKLDMKRGSVERWLREKYNREHPEDRIVHPRGFKFNDEQRQRLMDAFQQDRYPKPHDMELLAYELEVKREQVKNWFHDQRRKVKRAEQLAAANQQQLKTAKKSKYTKKQRKKLEEFFEKNFHPYPGDSRRIVNEFERKDGLQSRYQATPMMPVYGSLPNRRNMKCVELSRGFKFTEEQRERLKEAFAKNRYPTPHDMEQIATSIGARKVQVKNWFHDQRRKLKREQATR